MQDTTTTTATEQAITVEVARTFWDDHCSRKDEDAFGTVLRYGVKRVKVRLSALDAADLLSDAEYYASMGAEEMEYYGDVIASAKRVVRAIKKAQEVAAGAYVAPPRASKQQPDAHDDAYTQAELLAAMRKALKQHGLTEKGWTAMVNTRTTRTYGLCRYRERRIEVSWQIARLNDKAETMNTILHEVAHALAGGAAGHGDKWKAVCIDIGARPERCYDAQVVNVPWKWLLVCDGCGEVAGKRRKRPSRDISHWSHDPKYCTSTDGNRRIKAVSAAGYAKAV